MDRGRGMNAKQVGAVVAAVVLIVGAFVIRGVIDDDETADPTDPTPTTEPAAPESGSVICITELQAVCDQLAIESPGLDVTTEPALVTLDRLAAQTTGDAPVWVTIEPFPAMVDLLRSNANRDGFAWTNRAIGASQLAIAVRPDRLDGLEAACADINTWRCIGDAASFADLGGSGTVGVGFGDADRSASALAGLAAATAGFFDRINVVQADFDAEPTFRVWFRDLSTSTPLRSLSGGSPLATMLTRPAINVASTDEAQLAATPSAATGAAVNYPRPAMWLQAVVATPAGLAAPNSLVPQATETLGADGWAAAASADNALLSPNTMLALRELWQEAV